MKPRYSERRPVHATASFVTEEGVGYGCVQEISVPGCRLRTPAFLEVGQTLNLEFRFAGQDTPLRVPLAVVRWVQSPFAGLEFIGMSWPDQARLRQLVRSTDLAARATARGHG